jgi:hypothetical protein
MTTRILYRVSDAAQLPYPRQDDEPVLGLDHSILKVLQVIQEPPPEPGDGQVLQPTEAIDWLPATDPTGLDGTLTRGWELVPGPPAPVLPDWLEFAGWLYQFPPIFAAMDAARHSTDPQGEPATTGLPAAMDEARLRANYPAFAQTWGQFLLASGMAAGDLAQIVAKASDCNLPPEFITALQPQQPSS